MRGVWVLFFAAIATAGGWDEREVRVYAAELVRSLEPSFGEQLELIDSDRRVASVIPGQALLLSSAAFRTAASEAELAAMLAHAVAHLARFQPRKQKSPLPAWGLCYRSRAAPAGSPTPAVIAAEQQADLDALDLLAAAGFDPRSLATVYSRWRRSPLPGASVRARADSLSARWAELIENTSRFEELKSRLADR